MTYVLLSVAFLAVALLCGITCARAGGAQALSGSALVIAGVSLLVLTAVFDSLMIEAGLFTYTEGLISGLTLWLAPIEDFAYPLATVALLPALWALLTRPSAVSTREFLHQAWVSSRPVSWVNTAFPFAAAMLLTTREVDWLLVVGTLYYLVPYNLAMYGINDVFDYASDINNPRKGGIEGALLAPVFHRPLLWLALASNVPFLAVLVAAGNPLSLCAIGVSTFAVIAYSAPGLRFKERPVLDSVTSSIHFVSPAVVGLTMAGANLDAGLLISMSAFLIWGVAAHAFGAVQDVVPDREAGIGSIATAFGAAMTVRIALALWCLAGVMMLFAPWPGPLAAIIAVPYLVNCAPYVRVTDAGSGRTNRAWRRFIWLNYVSGFLVTLLLILAWTS